MASSAFLLPRQFGQLVPMDAETADWFRKLAKKMAGQARKQE
jgi:hypothetical protein